MEKIVKLFGGDIMTISNPMYPLKFEHFGEADLAEDPEFKSKLDSLYVMGSPVSCEMLAMPNAYASKRIYKAEEKARQCYVADDPVKGAKEALSISPYCPEAYNVMALFGADSYSEALESYNKAVEISPMISPDFASEVAEGACWSKNHLRSYFRAVHGQANTLRKMGRYKDALEKYLLLEKLDPNFHNWSSYANWRFHVLEVYMKIGDDKGALAFASKQSNHQAFGLASSASAWLWSVALLEFRYKRQRGFAKEYYEQVRKLGAVFPPPGAIMCASQASYHVLSFLTGERHLPNCKIPFVMRSESSLSNAAVYCTSNLELWRSTPGAIEWAAKNCHTHYCFLLLRKEKEILDSLKFKQTLTTFKAFVKKGIFLDSSIPGFEGGLVTEAVKANMVDELNVLLKAGAKTVIHHGRCVPQALHMACYYDHDPKIVELLCRYGADPSAKYGLHYCAIEMAAEQGAFRTLRAAIKSLPDEPERKREDLMNDILFVLFSTSCYECITRTGPKCQRCVHDSIGHAKDASFTACVDVVMETGYVPSRKYLVRLHQCSTFKQDLFDYILKSAIKVSPSLNELSDITSEAAWRNMCCVCGEADVKTKRCSGCRNIRYCSKKCQKADWKNHKRVCY